MLILVLGAGFLLASVVTHTKSYLPGITIVAGVICSRLPQLIFMPSDSNTTYTSFSISLNLIKKNFSNYFQQNPDFIILLILAMGLVCVYLFVALSRRGKGVRYITEITSITSLLVIIFCYTCVLLFWRWTLGYYLYVPVGLLSIVVISTLYGLRYSFGTVSKKVFIMILGIIALTRLISIPYNIYVAKAQHTMSSLYSESIRTFENLAPTNSTLHVENWNFYGEEVLQSNLLVGKIDARPDLKVKGIEDLIYNRTPADETLKLYGWTEKMDPKARYPKNGDYVLVFTADLPTFWMVRAVIPYVNTDSALIAKGYKLQLVSQDEVSYRLPFLANDSKGLRWRIPVSSQGFKLYKVINTPDNLSDIFSSP
jgi:hypothetical protein